MSEISLAEAARRSGVAASTLKRWAEQRIVPLEDGHWTQASAAQARIVARMRERGHSLREIKRAVKDGRLAAGFLEELLPVTGEGRSRREAAELIGMEDDLAERFMSLIGNPMLSSDRLTDEDIEMLWTLKRILDTGFPLVALLQLVRVYSQSLRRIAETEVRLFHLFVHEPLIAEGVPALEMAEQMTEMAEQLMPVIAPVTRYFHEEFLRHYMQQDVIGHMEHDLQSSRHPDHISMSFCFVDLTGFTRFTEEAGDETAIDLIERFVETVEATLPGEASLVKTIGDEVMIASPHPASLVDWAIGLLTLFRERPRPRAGIHHGRAVFRGGDYFGGDVNLAHRVVARAMAGEVVVTGSVLDEIVDDDHLRIEPIGEAELKGVGESTRLYLVDSTRT